MPKTIATSEVSPVDRTPLERLRTSLGLSREQLAVAAGVSATTIYNLERAGVHAQLSTQTVLAQTLRADLQKLFPSDA